MDRVYRSTTNRILGGVCGGLAEYFETDPLIIRLIFVFLALVGMSGLLIYVILWLVIPSAEEKPYLDPERTDRTNEFAQEIRQKMANNHSHAHNMLGVFLIFVGILFLLDNFYPGFGFRKLWPALIILVGLIFIARDHSRDHERR